MAFQKSILHPRLWSGVLFYKNCGRINIITNNQSGKIIEAVKAAINKAKICKKPIAGYDKEKKRAYVEYANGERKYV